MKHAIVYQDKNYYSAFTSIARLADGRLMVVFRRAPQRKPYSTHLDSHSQAVAVYSGDEGQTWSPPQVIWEEPDNVGVQDPSIAVLRDGTIVCNSFHWQVIKECPFNHYVIGTFVRISADNGKTWSKPVKVAPDALYGDANYILAATSEPVVELPDGELLVPLYSREAAFLCRSADKGRTWKKGAVLAKDPFGNHSFGEPAIAVLSSGKILCLLRETNPGYLWQTESTDGGRTWSLPRKLAIWGFPPNLLVLRDGRVLCSYGHRRPPYGVRACLSADEGATWNLREEVVIRNDGLHGDLGYPGATELPDGSILTSYYFHTGTPGSHNKIGHYSQPEGTRFIACSTYALGK